MNATGATRPNNSWTSTEPREAPTPVPRKLIIELQNLGEGKRRTILRKLKVLVENFARKEMISENIRVREEGEQNE